METKRTWWGLMCMLGMLGLLGVQGLAESYGGGSGTDVDPYQIWTAEQMNTIGLNYDKYFILMADIDMSAYTGTQYNIVSTFTGSFDGNGHVIRNLTYTTTAATDYVGLFGSVRRGQVKNLGLENVTISSAGSYVGGLAGLCSSGTISGCYCMGTISGSSNVGGLVGENETQSYGETSTITDCYSSGTVSGTSGVGGLVGWNWGSYRDAVISDCHSSSIVSGTSSVGGLVGSNSGYTSSSVNRFGIIKNSYSTGAASGYSSVGGLAGYNGSGDYVYIPNPIINCYSTATVTGSWALSKNIGGLVGRNEGFIQYSFSTGTVSTTVNDCSRVGGLVGQNYYGTLSDCCSTGIVSGTSYVGGLIGINGYGTVINCYSVGAVSGVGGVGGLVGYASTENYIFDSFWDTETSGRTTSSGGTGKTTAEMKTQATFTTGTAGKAGNALLFNGANSYVEVPGYYGISGSNPRTVSLWIKALTTSANQGLIQWGNLSTNQCYALLLTASGMPFVRLFTDSYITGTTSLLDNQWHHIATTFDESQLCLYVDGVLVGTSSVSSIDTGMELPVHMGLYQYNSSTTLYEFYYKGLMDEVCIYDRALAASEIVPEAPIPTDGLVAHWSMDETQGTTIHDSVSSHDGVLHNMSIGWDFDSVWTFREEIDYPRFMRQEIVSVPDVVNLPLADAESVVTSAGLTMGAITTDYSESIPAGNVISQLFSAGQMVVSGTRIDIILSLGPKPIYDGGSGTTADPYQISTAEQLNTIGANWLQWGDHFILMADIDMSAYTGTEYNIIGNSATPFTGSFDGNGHVINNLTYTTTETISYVGLFGYTQNAVIKDLGLKNVKISAAGSYIGGLIGRSSGGTVNSCYVTGAVSDGSVIGGLMGMIVSNAAVNACYTAGSVSGDSYVGGLIGSIGYSSSVSNCYSIGRVTGFSRVGGFAGDNGVTITNCFWNMESSEQSIGIGSGITTGVMGKTTIEMKTRSTFTDAGWDFADTWDICEGTNYPRFVWQIPEGDWVCPDGVNVEDLGYFVEQWLTTPCTEGNDYCDGIDMDESGAVDLADLAVFARHWLEGVN